MTPERQRQISELYHAARERGADALADADPQMKAEVEKLLAAEQSANTHSGVTQTVITPGAQIGPYRIQSSLGAGGMGEVFRAVDTRLDRTVAIKISRSGFSQRFGREARAIAALNHPNVCTLYDVGPDYLVMELIEGETLPVAARCRRDIVPAPVRHLRAASLTSTSARSISFFVVR